MLYSVTIRIHICNDTIDLCFNWFVFQTSWVKRAKMKVECQGKYHDCTLELEQGIGREIDGILTIQFKFKYKEQVCEGIQSM